MKERPGKTILPKSEQSKILKKTKSFVLKDLLPNEKINKIILFGSMAKGTFGRYEKSYKNRTYSDIDILLLVEDDFKVPKKWKPHYQGKLYNMYNIRRLHNRFLVQYMVCRKASYKNKKHQIEAEKWGVPLLLSKSKHKHTILHEKKS